MSKYDNLNEKLIELIKSGNIPWRKRWNHLVLKNPVTGTEYRGRNLLLLNAAPYESPYWVTYDQAKRAGGQVRQGEKSYPIVWFGEGMSKEDGKPCPILKGYNIFNMQQCDGLPFTMPEPPIKQFNPIEEAEKIVAWHSFELKVGGNRSFYSPSGNYIQLPARERFRDEQAYYLVLFHELIHWSGHPSRLNRPGGEKGTKAYDFEELVAEIGASYLSREAGLDMALLPECASYLQGYLSGKDYEKLLKGDKTLFIRASSKAQLAVNYILGVEEKEEEHA